MNFLNKVPFDKKFMSVITTNVKKFRSTYRNCKIEPVTGDDPYIQFLTPMELKNGDDTNTITFSIQLHQTYPSEPPMLLFIPDSSQTLREGPNLQSDGTIDSSGIFEWDMDMTLVEVYTSIQDHFSHHSPFVSKKRETKRSNESEQDFLGPAIEEAKEIISECNDKSKQLYELQLESAMLAHLKKVIEKSGKNVSQTKEVDKYIKPNLYPIQGDFTRDVEFRAQELASQKLIDSYKKAYENKNSIDINQFIREYRDMCNAHFKKFVWPHIKQ